MELVLLKHLSRRVGSRASGLLVVIHLLMISFYSGVCSCDSSRVLVTKLPINWHVSLSRAVLAWIRPEQRF